MADTRAAEFAALPELTQELLLKLAKWTDQMNAPQRELAATLLAVLRRDLMAMLEDAEDVSMSAPFLAQIGLLFALLFDSAPPTDEVI